MLVKRLPRPRAVAKGYLHKRTSDFSSFPPIASQVTLRVILALTVMLGFKSWDLDDTCVFITKVGYTQLKSDECVFVCQEDNVRKGSKSAKNKSPLSLQQ